MSEPGTAAADGYQTFCPRCGSEMKMRQFKEKGTLDDMITGFTVDWWCRTCRDRYLNIKIALLEEASPPPSYS